MEKEAVKVEEETKVERPDAKKTLEENIRDFQALRRWGGGMARVVDRPLGAGGDQEHDHARSDEESQGPGEYGERRDYLRGG